MLNQKKLEMAYKRYSKNFVDGIKFEDVKEDIARGEVSDTGDYMWAVFKDSSIGVVNGAVFGLFGGAAGFVGIPTKSLINIKKQSLRRMTIRGMGIRMVMRGITEFLQRRYLRDKYIFQKKD